MIKVNVIDNIGIERILKMRPGNVYGVSKVNRKPNTERKTATWKLRCGLCGARITKTTELKVHEKEYTYGNTEPIICKVCGARLIWTATMVDPRTREKPLYGLFERPPAVPKKRRSIFKRS